MRRCLLLFLFLFPCLALAQSDPLSSAYLPSIDTNPSDYPSNIWITDTMQKVRQDSGSPGAQHWGTFYGTQNEFIDFQVHYHDTGSGTTNLSVTVSDFVQASPSSFTISSAPTPLPPKVIVYREGYMDVTIPTATSVLYYGTTGYFPDALIPTVDPYWGQTTNAWPYNVAPGDNQSAWVDVLIPQNAPSGYYLGSVTVKSGSTILATMPVILAVWQWPNAGSMPSTPTLKTEETGWEYGAMCQEMYNGTTNSSDAGCANYPGAVAYGGSNDPDAGVTMVDLDADLLMKDHRWPSGGDDNIYPDLNSNNFTTFNSYVGPIMNGGCTHGGTVCPVLQDSKSTTKMLSLVTVNETNFVDYENDFVSQGWGTAGNTPLYFYLWDEPPANTSTWNQLNSQANTYHAYTSPSAPLLVTTDLAEATTYSGLNSIDIMVALINDMDPQGGTLQRSTYNTWLAGNCCGAGKSPTRQLWSYQSCNSASCSNGTTAGSYATWPNVYVDSYPVGNRVMEWLTFLHNQSGELYYDADYCYQSSVNCGGSYDPWVSIYTYGSWGDGTLVYVGCIVPGHPCYMGSGVTTPLILPSIRLEHMRDGVQDYEYLNALTNAGQGSLVQQEISSWITNSYTFETTGVGLQSARSALGTALHQLTYSSSGGSGGAPTLSISPLIPSVQADGTVQFDATASNMPAGSTLQWTASSGTISSTGLFTAPGSAGTVNVMATEDGVTASTMVTVTAATPTLSISPLTPSVQVDGTVQFDATASNMPAGSTLQWTASSGTISSTGLFTAPNSAKTVTVKATEDGITTSTTVTVKAATPTISISPLTPSVQADGTVQFEAMTANMSAKSTLRWTASGGTISSTGLFTAPSRAKTVTVKAAQDGVSASTTVTVTAKPK